MTTRACEHIGVESVAIKMHNSESEDLEQLQVECHVLSTQNCGNYDMAQSKLQLKFFFKFY